MAPLRDRVARLLADHPPTSPKPRPRWDETDAWLITYPDQFRRPGESPLRTLRDFYLDRLQSSMNGIHILPFSPSTSDEGFSIVDYLQVDPTHGTWDDIAAIARDARLMVDLVLNHCSVQSEWFRRWQAGDREYAGFFRTANPDADLSTVIRPRESPLLMPVDTTDGTRWVWTTFSADQVDLDYQNPEVLLRMLGVLLTYARKGASVIRLDAIGFLWKEEATPSIHLPQTHRIVQFLRACLDLAYPDVLLVSETNVPHRENISYLGNGTEREADIVYQFTLPPLVLHAFASGSAEALGAWASRTDEAPPGTTFLNFLASHDGVGLRPLEGIVDDASIAQLVELATSRGGLASMRSVTGGSPTPYELNATWYDLCRGETSGDDALAKHVASHAIIFALRGIPALYVHSLFATRNDRDAVTVTGDARAINRTRFADIAALQATLDDSTTRAARSLGALTEMLEWRRRSQAFSPEAAQLILDTPREVCGIERLSPGGSAARVYVNVSSRPVTVSAPASAGARGWRSSVEGDTIRLGPWGVAWLGGPAEVPTRVR